MTVVLVIPAKRTVAINWKDRIRVVIITFRAKPTMTISRVVCPSAIRRSMGSFVGSACLLASTRLRSIRNNLILVAITFSRAGLGNQGRIKDVGVGVVMRVENNPPIFLRSASFSARSLHVAIRVVMWKTILKGELSTKP